MFAGEHCAGLGRLLGLWGVGRGDLFVLPPRGKGLLFPPDLSLAWPLAHWCWLVLGHLFARRKTNKRSDEERPTNVSGVGFLWVSAVQEIKYTSCCEYKIALLVPTAQTEMLLLIPYNGVIQLCRGLVLLSPPLLQLRPRSDREEQVCHEPAQGCLLWPCSVSSCAHSSCPVDGLCMQR